MKQILGFFKQYKFLSNFERKEFVYRGKTYMSSEHAYQAAKATNDEDHEFVRSAETPLESRKRGRHGIKPRIDFDYKKYDIMMEILVEKFKDEELKQKLLDTDNAYLEETNYWHDNYWGTCTCDDCQHHLGQNNLGKILMIIRDNLKTTKDGSS